MGGMVMIATDAALFLAMDDAPVGNSAFYKHVRRSMEAVIGRKLVSAYDFEDVADKLNLHIKTKYPQLAAIIYPVQEVIAQAKESKFPRSNFLTAHAMNWFAATARATGLPPMIEIEVLKVELPEALQEAPRKGRPKLFVVPKVE